MGQEEKANSLRIFAEEIRVASLEAFREVGSGHVGGSMSIIETLAVLYGGAMKIDPKKPRWEERDWLVLSKGHAGPALYAVLALKGYFPKEELLTINKGGTRLPSHCDRTKTPGIDMTTGSLGQGFSAAVGVAMAHRISGRPNHTFVIVGDGELDEGQNWEAAMFCAHNKLDNLTLFVDWNKQQLDGLIRDVMDLGDLAAKFTSFGFAVQQVDGHDVDAISDAIRKARATKGKPSVIILDTIKGKGCTLAEGIVPCHHISFTTEKMDAAIEAAKQTLAAARAL